jgi:alpha-N-arabinofuranosidase
MRRVDPSIEIVAVGTSGPTVPSYPDWNRVVLEHAYDAVDYIAPHIYLGKRNDDPGDFLAQSLELEEFLSTVEATCDYARAKARSRRSIDICLDEWNVWYHTVPYELGNPPAVIGIWPEVEGISPWTQAPPIMEEQYTLEDALVVGLMLITLLRHARRVRIACLSTAVNNVGAVTTVPGGPAWRQTIFYPFLHASRYGRGEVLDVRVRAPLYESREFGGVPSLDAIATLDEEAGEATIFAVNRSRDEPLALECDLRGLPHFKVKEHLVLEHDDPLARNTAQVPDAVAPHAQGGATLRDGTLQAMLPRLSWNMIRLARRL